MISGAEVFIVNSGSPNSVETRLTDPRFIQRSITILIFITLVAAVGRSWSVAARENHAEQMTATIIRVEKDNQKSVPFYDALTKALKKRKFKIDSICPPNEPVSRRILEEYGAVYVASKKVKPPPVCVFRTEDEVTRFQEAAGYDQEQIGFDVIELQPEALKQLKKAREEAQKEGLDITPRDGAEAARRNYEDSVRLWNSRFFPALDYWLGQGRLTTQQVDQLKSLPLSQQVAEVLQLENSGMYFSKDLSKSILYSIAAPGTSQHIHMLAFDVNEFDNARVREIMAKHGWFQTVLSDLPHFTFLGLKEKDLPKNGLRSIEVNGQVFWIPNVPSIHPGVDGIE